MVVPSDKIELTVGKDDCGWLRAKRGGQITVEILKADFWTWSSLSKCRGFAGRD
jgi:hypothetical protein